MRQLLPDLLNALEYVHAQKMWHLDLKPGNILLKSNGHPVLIDFGASKQLGVGGANSTSIGMTYTQGYAPSEQVDQNLDRIGPWTDLYALGATLYNLLSGKTPPMVSEIQEAEADAFEFPKGMSEQMCKLILWSMNPNRRKRPQSVTEVRAFLQLSPTTETADNDDQDNDKTRMPDPVSTPQPHPVPFWQKLSNTQKGIMGGAAAAFLVLLVILLWPKDTTKDSSSNSQQLVQEIVEAAKPTTAADMACTSPIGDYRYTGAIDTDGKPHGKGKATFADGRIYEGPFVHGTMQGTDARFVMRNGDIFTGEIRDNRFYQGRYTVKEDASYFEGSFRAGQPDQGNWYDKNGNKI